MKIALFADLHGKLLLLLKLVDVYQKLTVQRINFILQCGDMGADLTLENLNKATLKNVKKKRNELSFYDDFAKLNQEIKTFLIELNVDRIDDLGNHKDHEFLNAIEQSTSLQKHWKAIW